METPVTPFSGQTRLAQLHQPIEVRDEPVSDRSMQRGVRDGHGLVSRLGWADFGFWRDLALLDRLFTANL